LKRSTKLTQRQTLDTVLNALGLRPDAEPVEGEAPDFVVTLSGRINTNDAQKEQRLVVSLDHGSFPVRSVHDNAESATHRTPMHAGDWRQSRL
jgi:hypothetical protein